MQSFIDNDIKAAGSRAELNRQLGQIGLNVKELKKIYEFEAKELIIEDELFGENGKEPVTDAEREEYYQQNYHRIKYVYLDPYQKYLTDEGMVDYDGQEANYFLVGTWAESGRTVILSLCKK